MSRAVLILRSAFDRRRAKDWIDRADSLSRIEFKGPARSNDQNAKMWAMLTEIALQVEWHGAKLKPDDWKVMFTASLRKARVVPNLEGDGFVVLGMSTSDMSKSEFSDLLESMHAFGAENGVVFHDDHALTHGVPPRALQHKGKAA